MSQPDESIRLNKHIALHAGLSRRQADELIEEGYVKINGVTAVLGARLLPNDFVEIEGRPLTASTEYVYLAFHKPTGYVCSRKQQGDSPTIYDLIPQQYHTLKPVGRLDRDSSGILLLTNDGDFAQQMTHPSYGKTKTYQASLDRALEPLHQQMISDIGVNLDDGKSQLTLERQSDDRRDWVISMHEGRNRQIRRTFAALGYTVISLHRTQFGNFLLNDLEVGKFSIIDKI